MESKSEKCKAEERQPDEVLRARKWLKTYERPLKHRTSWISTADVMNSLSTSELSEMLAAFAQSIQAEAEKEIERLKLELVKANSQTTFAILDKTGALQQLAEARAQVIRQLQSYDKWGFLGDVADPIYMEAMRIENMGFEHAHELMPCGHSRGDYRDPQYGTPEYRGNEKCVGCESKP